MRISRLISLAYICAATAFSNTLLNAQKLYIQPAVSISDVNASLPVAVDVNGTGVTPTGTVTLTGGGYSSGAQTLDNNGDYVFIIPANSLSVGTDALTVNYSGDTTYAPLSNSATVKVGASVPLMRTVIGPVATQVAAGAGHTCVLTAQSITQPETIQCWGGNNHGQLGVGTTTDTTVPVQVNNTFYTTRDPNDLNVISLAVGDNHTCALLPDSGQVTCWGANASGQLGNGTTADSSTPVLAMSLKIYNRGVALAAGTAHTCALLEDGTAQCWGDNAHGQLGDGSFANSSSPVAVSGLSNAIAIAAGGNHTCALLSDDSVMCWGENGNGQLGNASIKDSPTPVVVGGLGGGATLLALGGTHTCALLTDGTLSCWGGNAHGQLGNGSITDSSLPVAVSGLIGATTLAAGKEHTCAVVTAGGGTVACWGSNTDGQLGDNSLVDRTTPVHTGSLTKVAALSLGGSHSCAQNEVGVLSCWGDNATGQLGNGTKQAGGVLSPLPVNGMGGGAAMVSTGDIYACSVTAGGTANLGSGGTLKTNGAPFCWGVGGELGNGSFQPSATPVEVVGLTNTVKAIFTGSSTTCAVITDGSVDCWGDDFNTVKSLTPIKITGFSGIVSQIATTPYTNCALISNGTVQCWGSNYYGGLGDGTNNDSVTPVTVVSVSGAIALSGGNEHFCALLSGGAVDCWGDGTSMPAGVVGLSSAKAISAGAYSNCALLPDSTVQCWGGNTNGQLGNGTTSNLYTAPEAVVGLSGVTQISAGAAHVCALLADTTVQCWGANARGELGNGTTTNSSIPLKVTGLTGVTAISSGGETTLALVADGTLQGWGNNDGQQLGDSEGIDSSNFPQTSYVFPVPAFEGQSIEFDPPQSLAVGARIDLAPLTTGSSDLKALFDAWTIDDCNLTYPTGGTIVSLLSSTQPLLCGVRAVQSGGYNLHGGSLAPAPSQHRSVAVEAIVLTPHAALSPASLTFGSLNVGVTSAAQTLTLSNSGTATLNISGINITGASAGQFHQTNSCGSTLAAGASCALSVIFAPTAPASASATVSVADNASGSPQTAALSGTGTTPMLPKAALTPAVRDFGSVTVGSASAVQTFSLTNTSITALPIASAAISGPGAASFNIVSNTCSASLAGGASCFIKVSFTPLAAGPASASLAVSDSVGTQTASLTGTGVATAPKAALTPAVQDFGSFTVGSSGAAQTFTLTNAGTAALPITSVGISGSSAASFNITSNTCGASLAAGANCKIAVVFRPSAAGSASASLNVYDSVGTQSAGMTGTGVAPASAFTITPSALSFGNVSLGTTKSLNVTLTNISSTYALPVTISSSDPAIDTSLFASSCGVAIPVGGHCTAAISFKPTAAKNYSATITLGVIESGCTVCTISYPNQAIAATGVGIPPAFIVTPSALNFGVVTLGQTKSVAVTVKNVSGTSVYAKAALTSDPTIDITAFSSICAVSPIPVGGTCTAPLFFTPTAAKNYSATITLGAIATDCSGCTTVYANQTVAVTGVGAVPALSIGPSTISFGNVVVGLTKTQSVDIVNLSTTTVSIQTVSSSDPAISATGSCTAKPLAVGVHCSETIHFSPTATRNYSATITLGGVIATDCGGCTTIYANQTIAATGTGVTAPPSLVVGPSTINFGNVVVGLTKTQSVDVVNLSSTTVSIQTISSSDPSISVTGSCTAKPLAVGVHCSEAIHFTPTAAKNYSATITLGKIIATDCAGCTTVYPDQTISVTGTGVVPPPALAIGPSPIDFGNVVIGFTKAQSVDIVNLSSTTVSIQTIASSDPSILVTGSCTAKPLAVGVHCSEVIHFTPITTKSYSATVTLGGIIATDCSGCTTVYPDQTIAVTGTGVTVLPALDFAPSPINFGSIDVGLTKTQSVDVVNISSTPVSIQAITSSNPSVLLTGSCTAKPLAVGVHCIEVVHFTPTAAKNYSATVTLGKIIAICSGCITVYPNQTIAVTGAGIGPAFTITPSSLDFGNVVVGQTNSISVIVKNVSSTSVQPFVPTLPADPAINALLLGASCTSAALPVGGTCTGTITFSPTIAKTYSGTIVLYGYATDCSGCKTVYPNQTIAITGVGTPPLPAFTITPSSLNFGNVADGQKKSINVTLTNVSGVPVVPQSLSTSDGSIDALSLDLNCTLSPIPAGGSCTAPVSFAPTATKNYSGTITLGNIIAKCSGCTTTYLNQTIAVTGTGTPAVPAFKITPSPVAFGNVGVGESKSLNVTLTNVTGSSVHLMTLDPSDPAFSNLEPLLISCGLSPIPAGGSCTGPVFFMPAALKNYSGTITLKGITETCFGCTYVYPDQSIAITGTGATPPPAFTITPLPVNFGNVGVGESKSLNITLTNVSGKIVQLMTIVPSDPAFSNLEPLLIACGFSPIPAGGSCTGSVFFAPTALKNYGGTITIKGISAKCFGCTDVYPDQPIAVTGTGTPPPPAFTVTPSPVNFGNVGVGESKSLNVTLTNVSGKSVQLMTIDTSNPAFGNLEPLLISCGFSAIPAGGSCTGPVSFMPTTLKNFSGTITIKGIAAKCFGCTDVYPDQLIAINGTGVAPPPAFKITPSSVNFGNVGVGELKSLNITLTNVSSTNVQLMTIDPSDPAFSNLEPLLISCGLSPIPAGGSCTGSIFFMPTAVKSYSGTITLRGLAAKCFGCTAVYPDQAIAVIGTGFGTGPAPPVFSPSGGTFTSKQIASLSDATPGSTIHYTVDGSTPTPFSPVYLSPIEVDSTKTIRAIAVTGTLSGILTSPVSSASYIITLAACQTIDYSSGFTASGLSLNGGATISGTALKLTDGGPSEARSAFFSTTLPTTSFTTDFTFQITDPAADGMTFTIQSNNPRALGLGGGGLGYAGIPNSVAVKVDLHNNAGEGTDSTGTYIDGAYPSVPAINLAPAGINLHSGHIFAGHLAYASGLTKATITDTVTGVSASMNFPGDITKVVGNNAWFGFTAGTGGNSATQKILTWSYSGGAGCPSK